MPDEIVIDGMAEEDFRRSIEAMLRQGRVDEAVDRLEALLPAHCGAGGPLPERFLVAARMPVRLDGWERLAGRLAFHDRPGRPITAIAVQTYVPEDAADGVPRLATTYFSDAPFPFSQATLDDLMEGYTVYGCQWDGDFDEHDDTLALSGIEDLQRAVAALEASLMTSDDPPAHAIEAGAIGACLLGVLLHRAVRDAVRDAGLPRPICVFAGNSGTYPFFDAPVSAAIGDGDELADTDIPCDDEPAGMASLESLIATSARKARRPVIVLEDEPALATIPEFVPDFGVEERFDEPVARARTLMPRLPAMSPPPPPSPVPVPVPEPVVVMPILRPTAPPASPAGAEPDAPQIAASPLPLHPDRPLPPEHAEQEPMMTTRELIAYLRAQYPDPAAASVAGAESPLPAPPREARTVDSWEPIPPRRSRRAKLIVTADEPKSRQYLDKLWELPVLRSLARWLRGS